MLTTSTTLSYSISIMALFTPTWPSYSIAFNTSKTSASSSWISSLTCMVMAFKKWHSSLWMHIPTLKLWWSTNKATSTLHFNTSWRGLLHLWFLSLGWKWCWRGLHDRTFPWALLQYATLRGCSSPPSRLSHLYSTKASKALPWTSLLDPKIGYARLWR